MRRFIALMLFTAMLVSSAACASGESAVTTVTETQQLSETTAAETPAINPALPERDYGGYEFKLLSTDEVGSIRYSREIYAEEETGEPLNDAVYARNRMVEEEFNAKIMQITSNKDTFVSTFKNTVLAGDDSYDVLVAPYDVIVPMGNVYGLELSDIPYLDIDNEWWDGDFIRETALCGKMYGLLGDINIVDNGATWSIFFNKRLADEYVDADLYELVRSGKWTIDKLAEYCRTATRDLDGNSQLDYKDQWGMTASANVGMEFIWSSGSALGKLNKDGKVDFTVDSEININALNKAYELFADKSSVIMIDSIPADNGKSNWENQRSMFREGRVLFIGSLITNVDSYRDMNDEFGILPMPKYSEAQEKYCTTAQEWCATMYMAPVNATNPERTGILLEAMSSAAVSTITPAYFDLMLSRKLVRDDESSEMLDIIFDSRRFDIVFAFNWGGVRNLPNSLTKASNTIASDIAGIKTSVQTAYEKTLDAYQKD